MDVEPGPGGLADGGEQVRALGREPCPRLVRGPGPVCNDPGGGWGERDGIAVRFHHPRSGIRRVQVVVEQPADRRVPVRRVTHEGGWFSALPQFWTGLTYELG